MLSFTYPWLFTLLVLPYFVYRYVPAYRTRQSAIQVPFFDVLVDVMGLKATKGATQLKSTKWQRLSLVLGWSLLVTAMAQPVIIGEPQTKQLSGRDLMVVVDLSGSMATEDFTNTQGDKISRLQASKDVLAEFSQQRKGDRLGLILFGDSAFLQAPLTADHSAWNTLLNESRVAMAGQSTHLGDAIGLGIKTFKSTVTNNQALEDTESEKVMIVLTDGNDTDSLVPPIEAAKIAAAQNIRIYMVAIGDPVTVGENAMDMETIDKVASITGGELFFALSPSELSNVYRYISELEPSEFESFTYQPQLIVHHYPVILLLLNYLLMMSFYTLKKGWIKHKAKQQKGADHGAV